MKLVEMSILFLVSSNIFIFKLISASVSSVNVFEHLNVILTVEYITRTFALKQKRTLTFLANAEDEIEQLKFGELIDGILKRMDFSTVQIDHKSCVTLGRREFNVLFVDSFKALRSINPADKSKSYDFNEYYLIFLTADSKEDLPRILKYFWDNYIINVSILVEDSPKLTNLYTFFPFSKNRCRNTNPILINQFQNGRPKNGKETKNFFPEKLEDLQECPLIAAIWDVSPYLNILPNRNGLDKFIGFEGVLLRVLAKKLTFSLDYITPPNHEERGKRFPNGTISGAMKLLKERTADLSLGSFRYSMERAEVMTAAVPYYQTWQVFAVPKSSFQYSPIEILVFPFTPSTWISLFFFVGVIISFGLLAISYHRILGPMFLEITANQLVASFLGASMSNLPNGNFIRYMLILWVIFSFVIRCAYQSLLFKLLQTNLDRNPPKTFQELIDRGYTLAMSPGTFDTVGSMLKLDTSDRIPYIITKNASDVYVFDFIEETPDVKLAAATVLDFLTYYVMSQSKRGTFYVLPDKISAQHNTLYFSKHSFLVERFNRILINLQGSGLINLWASQSMDTSYFRAEKHVKVALKLKKLSGTFDVYLVLLLVACFVFLLELISRRVQVIRRVLEFVC